jgi:hypothetical protein
MIAALAMPQMRRRTIMEANAANAIQQVIGLRLDLTTMVRMTVSRAILGMRQITIMRVNVRIAIIQTIHGQIQASTMQDLTIVSPVTRTINPAATTQDNVPIVIQQAVLGVTRILITVD